MGRGLKVDSYPQNLGEPSSAFEKFDNPSKNFYFVTFFVLWVGSDLYLIPKPGFESTCYM